MYYEEFKMEMIDTLKDYLPEKFQSWRLLISTVPKVNGSTDVITLMPEKKGGAVPNLYVDKFYQVYLSGFDAESAIRDAAAEFLAELEYLKHTAPDCSLANPEKRIIYVFVNTALNKAMLEGIPHREILDLSLIYRFVVEIPGNGFHSTIITDSLASDFGFSEEDLFQMATENTPEFMPLEMLCEGDGFYTLGNTRHCLGAASILYDGVLESLAELLGEDLYLLPASIHEVFAVRSSDADPVLMRNAVRNGNQTVVGKDEILSDNVYLYRRKEHSLELLEFKNSEIMGNNIKKEDSFS